MLSNTVWEDNNAYKIEIDMFNKATLYINEIKQINFRLTNNEVNGIMNTTNTKELLEFLTHARIID